MGNTASKVVKVVDFGLKAACYATGGLFGNSSEGFHLGPLRMRKDSFGVRFNVFGICSIGLNIGRNEFGKLGLDASASIGINKFFSSGTIRTGWDEEGLYMGVEGTLNAGKFKYNGKFVANRKGVRSMDGGVYGPLLTNINYSSNGGLSVGALGAKVNTNLETDFSNLEEYLAEETGRRVREIAKEKYKTKNKKSEKETELDDKKPDKTEKDESNCTTRETKNEKEPEEYCPICKGRAGKNKKYLNIMIFWTRYFLNFLLIGFKATIPHTVV